MEHNPNQQPATPEEIWDILRSVSAEQKKLSQHMRETDQLIKETEQQQKETAQLIKETGLQQKETSPQMKETDRRIENRMKYLEHLFTGQWGKQIYGAMAYLRVPQAAEVYAERQGLFVIRATRSSASIVNQADF